MKTYLVNKRQLKRYRTGQLKLIYSHETTVGLHLVFSTVKSLITAVSNLPFPFDNTKITIISRSDVLQNSFLKIFLKFHEIPIQLFSCEICNIFKKLFTYTTSGGCFKQLTFTLKSEGKYQVNKKDTRQQSSVFLVDLKRIFAYSSLQLLTLS